MAGIFPTYCSKFWLLLFNWSEGENVDKWALSVAFLDLDLLWLLRDWLKKPWMVKLFGLLNFFFSDPYVLSSLFDSCIVIFLLAFNWVRNSSHWRLSFTSFFEHLTQAEYESWVFPYTNLSTSIWLSISVLMWPCRTLSMAYFASSLLNLMLLRYPVGQRFFRAFAANRMRASSFM